jgi:hypothetical protein
LDPYLRPATNKEISPQSASNKSGWIIGILFVLLAIGVGFGAFKLLSPQAPPPAPLATDSIAVPSVLQKDQATALSILTAAGFKVNVQPGNDSSIPTGIVGSQDPAANAAAKKGDSVTIFVGGPVSVPVTVTMPNVVGKPVDDALKEIKEAGFSGRIVRKTQESPDSPAGTVLSSDPPASTIVAHGTRVTLVITPETVTESVDMGAAPDVGAPMTHVRLMVENPVGSTPTVGWDGTLKPGDPIPTLPVKRKIDDQIRILLLAGKDETSLSDFSDKFVPLKQAGGGQ